MGSGIVRGAADAFSQVAFRWAARALEVLLPPSSHRLFGRHPPGRGTIPGSFEREKELVCGLGLFADAVSVLSLAPGPLELALLGDHPDLRVGWVEPDPRSAESFDRELAEHGWQARVVERHVRTFRTCRLRARYDVVLAPYCWPAVGERRVLLQKALAARRPGGYLAILLPSAEDRLRDRLGAGAETTAESLSTWARAEGFAHREERFFGEVPLDAVVDGDQLTEAGRVWATPLRGGSWEEDPTPEDQELVRCAFLEAAPGGLLRLPRGALIFGPAPS